MDYQDFELLVTPDREIRAASEQGEVADELHLDVNEMGLALQLRPVNAFLVLAMFLWIALQPGAWHLRFRRSVLFLVPLVLLLVPNWP